MLGRKRSCIWCGGRRGGGGSGNAGGGGGGGLRLKATELVLALPELAGPEILASKAVELLHPAPGGVGVVESLSNLPLLVWRVIIR